MKEEYVTYEQSQALKRLGFKEETTHYYVNFKSDGEVKLWSCNPPDNHNARLSINEVCSAPRLDQAVAWMREEKGIFVGVIYDNNMSNYNPYGFRVQIPMCNDRSALGFHEYNQALSAGIDKALELLTIKSNGKWK